MRSVANISYGFVIDRLHVDAVAPKPFGVIVAEFRSVISECVRNDSDIAYSHIVPSDMQKLQIHGFVIVVQIIEQVFVAVDLMSVAVQAAIKSDLAILCKSLFNLAFVIDNGVFAKYSEVVFR